MAVSATSSKDGQTVGVGRLFRQVSGIETCVPAVKLSARRGQRARPDAGTRVEPLPVPEYRNRALDYWPGCPEMSTRHDIM